MQVTTRQQSAAFIIELHGKLMGGPDAEPLQDAVKRALEENQKQVVMDLEGVEWVNSMGLGVLVAAHARLGRMDSQMVLARPNSSVSNLLSMNKLNRVFDIFPSVEAAVGGFH